MVSNTTVPREDMIIADAFITMYKFLIELFLCYLLALFYGLFNWASLLFLIPLVVAYLAFTLGVGLILSTMRCFSRDISHVWTIMSRFLLFATPIFYPLNSLSPGLGNIIYWLNPLTPFLISFRDITMNTHGMSIINYFYSLFLGVLFFIFGYYVFITNESVAMERA